MRWTDGNYFFHNFERKKSIFPQPLLFFRAEYLPIKNVMTGLTLFNFSLLQTSGRYLELDSQFHELLNSNECEMYWNVRTKLCKRLVSILSLKIKSAFHLKLHVASHNLLKMMRRQLT